mmetsp:Transcript_6474/g.9210  ORF Transcript_6474/g.9210 Transcript_6474/m.9210 type:complete len:100 (+) Transcript_6474:32-331(+)
MNSVNLHNLISKIASCKERGIFILPPHLIDVFLSAGESSLCFELTSAYHGRSRTSTRVSYYPVIAPTQFLVPVETMQPLQAGTSASIERKALCRNDHES